MASSVFRETHNQVSRSTQASYGLFHENGQHAYLRAARGEGRPLSCMIHNSKQMYVIQGIIMANWNEWIAVPKMYLQALFI